MHPFFFFLFLTIPGCLLPLSSVDSALLLLLLSPIMTSAAETAILSSPYSAKPIWELLPSSPTYTKTDLLIVAGFLKWSKERLAPHSLAKDGIIFMDLIGPARSDFSRISSLFEAHGATKGYEQQWKGFYDTFIKRMLGFEEFSEWNEILLMSYRRSLTAARCVNRGSPAIRLSRRLSSFEERPLCRGIGHQDLCDRMERLLPGLGEPGRLAEARGEFSPRSSPSDRRTEPSADRCFCSSSSFRALSLHCVRSQVFYQAYFPLKRVSASSPGSTTCCAERTLERRAFPLPLQPLTPPT